MTRAWLAIAVIFAATAYADQPKHAPTKQQLADYRAHLKAGLAAQQAKKWTVAVAELEAALKAIDADQRALAELGWSAMNAGDFAKARRADTEAVRVALDPKVKAAALYNLGLVDEKSGDKDGALKSYLESLKLRPNKTVADAVTRLGATPTAELPLCKPGQDACACVLTAAFGDYDRSDPPPCQASDGPKIPGASFQAYSVSQGPWSWTYLLDEHRGLVAIIAGGLDRDRVTERLGIDKVDVRTLSDHRVLWLQTTDAGEEVMVHDDDAMDMITDDTTAVTLCVIGDAKTPTRCPLRDVPIIHSHQGEHDAKPAVTKVELALAPDGTATVKLLEGASDPALDALVGPHKLW